ncbi:MAG: phosphate ABC transporter substrate-binding protein [Syntrophaceticus schinkii]
MIYRSKGGVVALFISLMIFVILGGCARPNPANTVNIAGSSSVQPLSEELANAFMKENSRISINVAGGGSSAGIKAVREGTADIGASSRELERDEKNGLMVIPIAIDGIALVVNPENRVNNLTLEQVRRIYAGEITNWKEVGGKEGVINAFTREEGSGTRGAFEDLVMKDSHISSRVGVQNATGSLRTAVAADPKPLLTFPWVMLTIVSMWWLWTAFCLGEKQLKTVPISWRASFST